jgi:hypothetical protein
MVTVIRGYDRAKVDVERMYDELSTYHHIYMSFKINKSLLKSEKFITSLDDKTHITFHSPDQIVLFENWDGKNGVTTGIDFERALEMLEPYMRKRKIDKIIKKTL